MHWCSMLEGLSNITTKHAAYYVGTKVNKLDDNNFSILNLELHL